ncbi:protoporphyrinogen oxidase [Ammoniphilus sp. CFH 90114]|uniref:protoporphyrinogen oxidase n=1 Tax=Ammoniphilus sp. CFH 90114 TaxID=2493665 RepID=UPI00100E8A2C|nr:protoporphyrinogen oxidase [Ammoniphilus sp. CFH 90114]RXT04126.1 protoporphyrinogen oxidase [Ammoniphilus sp. CFH 90114]
MDKQKHIMVVGGGITGLTAAYYLQKQVKEKQYPISITLVEKSHSLGGKIQTEHTDGFVIEKGPDSFLARKPAIMNLIAELGLQDELVGTNPAARKNYILHQNRLHLMPPGLILGIPTQITPFVRTGLISPLGKARAAMDLLIPSRKEEGDESLGGFLQRRLGREVAENIAEPLLSGIYAGDTQMLSLDATFPQFKSIEKKYGSIIKGMLLSRKSGAASPQPQLDLPPGIKNSMFLTFRNGLVTLIDAMIRELDQVTIRTNDTVSEVIPHEGGGQYTIHTQSGEEILTDAIVLATPAFVTKGILKDIDMSEALSQTPYVSVANVALAYDRKDIEHPLDASGFVVPRKEGRSITACTWTSSKWLQSSPHDKVLLRCYIGHSRDQSHVEWSDEELLHRVKKDLKEILDLGAAPIFHKITRWKNSMPQYRVHHLDRLHQVRAELEVKRPGIYLAGAGYEGVGIPDCIGQGKMAAVKLMDHLMRS